MNRFSSTAELIGFIGWHPKISESEEKRSQHPKMSKKGSPTLRAALYMASIACIKHNRELKSLYLKKTSQGEEVRQTLVCVGKKLAYIMYSMLKNGTSYGSKGSSFKLERDQILALTFIVRLFLLLLFTNSGCLE